MVRDLRAKAGDRADHIELALNVFAVGTTFPPHLQRQIGADAETLIAADSLSILTGDTATMITELQRRREDLGVSYVAVNFDCVEQLAPAVEALDGT